MTARVDLVSVEGGGSEEGEGTSDARAGICEAEPGSVRARVAAGRKSRNSRSALTEEEVAGGVMVLALRYVDELSGRSVEVR